MKISIDGYSFHGLLNSNKMDIYHYLESVKYRYNVDAVGIWNGMFPEQLSSDNKEDDNKPELAANKNDISQKFISDLRDALVSRNLVLPNIAVDWAAPWDDNEKNRISNIKNAWAHLRAAVELGASTVRIDWGIQQDEISTEQMDYIVSSYKDLCEFAQENSMIVGPENHFGASLNLDLQLEVAQAIDSPVYGILMHLRPWKDVQMTGQLKKLVPYIMHTHLPQEFMENEPKQLLKLLIENGYNGYWGVEHHTASNEYNMVQWQLGLIIRELNELGVK